jgi:hypothetical protein
MENTLHHFGYHSTCCLVRCCEEPHAPGCAASRIDIAHFPKLENTIITTEPEAAAIYTLKILRGTAQESELRIGDGFTVCDLGGDTVDLTSYKVAGLDPIVLEEATVGIGDQCGGDTVDRTFLRWLERRLGAPDFVLIAGCRSEEVSPVLHSLRRRLLWCKTSP